MPKDISPGEKALIINMMVNGKGQREINRLTGISRGFIRDLAKKINFQFKRNGFEILGQLCMCANCGGLFRRPPSKVRRAKTTFCSPVCKMSYMKGINHPGWGSGEKSLTFSMWCKNQSFYKDWREQVLERDEHKCIISGREDNLEAHHVLPKAEDYHPEEAFNVDNGITLNKEVHQKIHDMIRDGWGFEECIEKLKQDYKIVDNGLKESEDD
jgi:hypothetical protein